MTPWICIVSSAVILGALCVMTVTATIFPEENMDYRHYAKREINSDCLRCARTYNYIPCLRCWNSKYAVIPFHSKRSSEPAATDFAGSDIVSRDRRYTGCNCCFQSRFSNSYCCEVCNTATKRMGKRDPGLDLGLDTTLTEPVKRMDPSCMCCASGGSGSYECCNACIRRYVYY